MTDFNRKQLQARNPARVFASEVGLSRRIATQVLRGTGEVAMYPEVPAGWPNRATRRAVKQGRFQRLSGEWRQVLANHPALVPAIKTL